MAGSLLVLAPWLSLLPTLCIQIVQCPLQNPFVGLLQIAARDDDPDKVHTMMSRGATNGERSAARARAEVMAAKAGMTLKQAVSSLDSKPKAQTFNFTKSFDDAMEEKHPGWKAAEAAKHAERVARNEKRRAAVMAAYGSRAKLFAPTEREIMLDAAISPFVSSWSFWIDDDGGRHRYAKTFKGIDNLQSVTLEKMPPLIKDAITHAYPWPSNLDVVLGEVKFWDDLWYERTLFSSGEWSHPPEVDFRIDILRHALTSGQPAASWDDVQARFDWKRHEYRSQWIDPHDPVDPFMDRLEADIMFLRREYATASANSQKNEFRTFGRTTVEKRKAVLSMLDTQPELSDREIARRLGVSPQTVNTWRKKQKAQA